ncbi:MAG: cobaltochelatase CobT-related protein [Alphaproteobacteria bacterium]
MASKKNEPDYLEDFRRVTGATARALSGETELEAVFAAKSHGLIGNELFVTSPSKNMSADEVRTIRAEADKAALRLKHHDADTHRRLTPADHMARTIFEALEDVRIETIGANRYKGIAQNLDHLANKTCQKSGYDRVENKDDAPVAEALRHMAKSAMTGRPIPEAAQKLVDAWMPEFTTSAVDAMGDLLEKAEDQEEYAKSIQTLMTELNFEFDPEQAGDPEDSDAGEDGDEDDEANAQPQGEDDQESETSDSEEMESEGEEGESADSQEQAEGSMDESMESADGEEAPGVPIRPPEWLGHNSGETFEYRAYTTEYDEVVTATDLCDSDEELTRLRAQLDHQQVHLQGVIAKIANRMQRKLMAKQQRSWDFNLEEGLLDTSRLTRVITSPENPLSYMMESDIEFRDTVVTLLIDNSGSMRGRPISTAAISADILARTLERCAVKVEILGFTTKMWKGGNAREKWIADGKPNTPGRLNDLRHIVYKAAETPWRRARKNLGLMLREGLLKENIDGEALLWALNRLMGRPEQRRILMVISDGAPVDDSTLSVNAGNYLDRHLNEIIKLIEDKSPVELIAIGIGHDVTRHYKNAVTIVDPEQLGGVMMDKLIALFEDKKK